MKLLTAILLGMCILLTASFAGAQEKAEEAAEFDYVGATKCKICHKPQFEAWAESKHAKAFDVLSDEEKKKEECISCHMTGTTAKDELLEGVQCEACHGPGSEYKSPKIMSKKKWPEDPEGHLKMAMDAGLVLPTEETCVQCHKKEGNPNFKEFNFAERVTEIHPISEERLTKLLESSKKAKAAEEGK